MEGALHEFAEIPSSQASGSHDVDGAVSFIAATSSRAGLDLPAPVFGFGQSDSNAPRLIRRLPCVETPVLLAAVCFHRP